MRLTRVIHDILLSLGAGLLLALIAFSGVLDTAGGWAYDRLLALRKPYAAPREVLLVDIDDRAATAAGAWPWSRDILADGIVLLAEMNARSTVLDLPLGRKSQPGLDPSALRQGFPDVLDREFTLMEQNIQTLFDAIRRGSVRPKDSARYVGDVIGLVAQAKLRLLDAATGIERDDDALLGQAVQLFGRSYVPMELLPSEDPSTDHDLLQQMLQRLPIAVGVPGRDPSFPARALRPPVLPLLRGARGGGFTEASADADGVHRRAYLTARYDAESAGYRGAESAGYRGAIHFAQITFAALLDLMDNPAVELHPDGIVLRTVPPRVIALTGAGEALIEWPHPPAAPGAAAGPETPGADGLRHLSWSELLRHQQLEESLLTSFRNMDAHGYLSYLRNESSLLDVYNFAAQVRTEMLGAGEDTRADEWRQARERFFGLADQFLNGDAEARIVADAGRSLQSTSLSDPEKLAIRLNEERVPGIFSEARQTFDEIRAVRAGLHASVGDSMCIISLAGSQAPAPAGRTPFGAAATDASASAAFASAILAGRSLREVPRQATAMVSVALALLLGLCLLKARPAATLFIGLGAAAAALAGFGGAFVLFGGFMNPLVPGGSAALAGIVLSLDKTVRWRRNTRALRHSFAGRLSGDGMAKVLAAPEALSPRGGRRNVTVLAAAVKGLPSGAALEEPGAVVKLLNSYHAAVREVVLGLDGILGRSAADAVAAYFGAPIALPDHPARACRAALRIKTVEKELGALAAPPFVTRIGIETGECVVGEIGAGSMPEYAVVGAATDLASRLESLNARYGTSIIISEAVRQAAGEAFLVRSLDRVHIAGTEAVFRVFELMGEKAGAPEATLEALRYYEEALERFADREWARAEDLFNRVLSLRPGDGPSLLYIQRCRERAAHPSESPPTAPC
ncbi:MAG: CHASE2 domain-containing protein [Spirochaetia bacterium]